MKTLNYTWLATWSSSTELDIKHEEEKIVRRSKRLTKTNPIIRYNNPPCHDYRNQRRKAEHTYIATLKSVSKPLQGKMYHQ